GGESAGGERSHAQHAGGRQMTRSLRPALFAGGVLFAAAGLVAQTQTAVDKPPQSAPVKSSDPRVGLKPGVEDAGAVARHIELIGHLPKPPDFNDPAGVGSLHYANSD